MIQSMTGFAERYFKTGSIVLKITIKSLNHRFLDWNFRGGQIADMEGRLRSLCQAELSRGRIEVSVDIQFTDPARWEVRINEELLAKIFASLEQVSGRLNREVNFSVDHVFGIPHVIELTRKELNPREEAAIEACFKKALKELIRVRRQEGRRLRSAILAHWRNVYRELRIIEARGRRQPRLIRKKMEERLHELSQDGAVREDKLIEETALLAQRYDLAEEIVRLKSHLAYLHDLLTSKPEGPVGKKLDFLAQELFREINTLNSKAQDIAIIQRSLTVKGELESIRQQVQNLE